MAVVIEIAGSDRFPGSAPDWGSRAPADQIFPFISQMEAWPFVFCHRMSGVDWLALVISLSAWLSYAFWAELNVIVDVALSVKVIEVISASPFKASKLAETWAAESAIATA